MDSGTPARKKSAKDDQTAADVDALYDQLVSALAATGVRMSAERSELVASALRRAYAVGARA